MQDRKTEEKQKASAQLRGVLYPAESPSILAALSTVREEE